MKSPNSISRRDRRIAARKIAILEAAGRLFAEKGYHRTTTKDIAEAADVSEGTIYNYFSNKEELLFGIMAYLSESDRFARRLSSALQENPQSFLISILNERQLFLQTNRIMLQAILSEILVNPELRQRYYQDLVLPAVTSIMDHLQERVRMKQIRPLDVPFTSRILVAITLGSFMLQVLGDKVIQSDLETLSETLTEIIFDGVRPQERGYDT
jgi:AcrR family transcriptional regulator